MNTREHYELFRYLMEQLCLLPEDLVFVENIADWCEKEGIPETDKERPLKLVSKEGSGCRMLIKEYISDEAMHQRLNALRVRSQLNNVAFDRADALDSERKRLAYLLLSEYAISLPGIEDDLLADEWAFYEMKRLGFFKQ
jgi:hypothetical protein